MSYYSDLDYKLTKNTSGTIKKVEDIDSVKQSIKIILSTSLGERIMEPDFGSRLRNLLFEQMDDITTILIELEIQETIEKWEDRVIINNVNVVPNYDINYYDVYVDFTVIRIDKRGTFEGKIKVSE